MGLVLLIITKTADERLFAQARVGIQCGIPVVGALAGTNDLPAHAPRLDVVRIAADTPRGVALARSLEYIRRAYGSQCGVVVADPCYHADDVAAVVRAAQERPSHLILGAAPAPPDWQQAVLRRLLAVFSGIGVGDLCSKLYALPPQLCAHIRCMRPLNYRREISLLTHSRRLGIPIEELPLAQRCAAPAYPTRSAFWLDLLRTVPTLLGYASSSLLAGLVDLSLFTLMIKLVLPQGTPLAILASTATARVFSSVVNFITNRNMVFHAQGTWGRMARRYYGLVIGQLLLSSTLIRWLSAYAGLNMVAAKVLADSALYFLSFTIQREYVFGAGRRAPTRGA